MKSEADSIFESLSGRILYQAETNNFAIPDMSMIGMIVNIKADNVRTDSGLSRPDIYIMEILRKDGTFCKRYYYIEMINALITSGGFSMSNDAAALPCIKFFVLDTPCSKFDLLELPRVQYTKMRIN